MKVILLDIDGTLFNDDKEMTKRTKEALIAAQNQGIRLVLASGRPTQGLEGIAHDLKMDQHHGLLISYNGSKVTDCETGEVLFDQALSQKDVVDVLNHVASFDGLTAMIDHNDVMYVTDIEGYKVEYETGAGGFKAVEKPDLANHIDFTVNKILTSAKPSHLEKIAEELKAPFIDRLSCMFTAPFYFEFTPLGVDKGKTMEKVFTDLGLKAEEMIAFGDAENDISMLNYAGYAVAMGNATDAVKAVADEVTLDNNHDGIAETLYRLNIVKKNK